jgi:hypothetical protein
VISLAGQRKKKSHSYEYETLPSKRLKKKHRRGASVYGLNEDIPITQWTVTDYSVHLLNKNTHYAQHRSHQ